MADGLVYKLLSLTIPLDRNGNPVPDIVIDVNGQKVHADITYEVWCEMVNSNDRSRELYLNTMLAFLVLRVVLKAKAFNNLKLDYRDLLYWARHSINTKWNFAEPPQCSCEFYKDVIG